MHVDVDPYQPKPTFTAAAELTHVDLTKFQDFARAYGGFDFQSGWLSIYTELASAKGRFTGYVKPLITDLQIPNWNEEPGNFLQRIWSVLVGVTAKAQSSEGSFCDACRLLRELRQSRLQHLGDHRAGTEEHVREGDSSPPRRRCEPRPSGTIAAPLRGISAKCPALSVR
jgi:hypothetical protein